MAGMLFFCKRALSRCYELSVLNPSHGVGNKRGQRRTTVRAFAPDLGARNSRNTYLDTGVEISFMKQLSKFACVDGLECREQNEMKLLLCENDSRKLPSRVDESFGPNRILLESPRSCKLHRNYLDKQHSNRTRADQMIKDFNESDTILLSMWLHQGLMP